MYVQYGCGLTAPDDWINFDSSPTLKIQKIPFLGKLILELRHPIFFPDNVKVGDIVKGLPISENSCNGLYCSHVLEHLSLQDFRIALANSFKVLKQGGIFRCVMPDLYIYHLNYMEAYKRNSPTASIEFMNVSLLGMQSRPRSVYGRLIQMFGNSYHLWMWDEISLRKELEYAGFVEIRRCQFNDAEDPMFEKVELEGRFKDALAMEASK